jgi:hypothetical protein
MVAHGLVPICTAPHEARLCLADGVLGKCRIDSRDELSFPHAIIEIGVDRFNLPDVCDGR